jgi:hypothetical protein
MVVKEDDVNVALPARWERECPDVVSRVPSEDYLPSDGANVESLSKETMWIASLPHGLGMHGWSAGHGRERFRSCLPAGQGTWSAWMECSTWKKTMPEFPPCQTRKSECLAVEPAVDEDGLTQMASKTVSRKMVCLKMVLETVPMKMISLKMVLTTVSKMVSIKIV